MAEFIPVNVFDIVIFGGTGDLSKRKLIPALWHRFQDNQIPEGSRIIGAARSEMDLKDFLAFAKEACIAADDGEKPDKESWEQFAQMLRYVAIDATKGGAQWDSLKQDVNVKDGRPLVFYLATAPRLYVPICEQLGQNGLNQPSTRVVLEKPIGRNLETAQEINAGVGAIFEEKPDLSDRPLSRQRDGSKPFGSAFRKYAV